MVEQPTPEAQQAVLSAMAQSWLRTRGKTARFLEHGQKDIHDKAWQAGYEFGKKGK